jgi:tetratricopeptide (TPR) repeat protein
VVLRGIASKQADRYPSMDALLAALSKDPRVFWRRLLVGAAVGVVVIAALVLAVLSQLHRQELCTGFEAKLAGVWDDTVREKVRVAFLKTERSYAEDTFGRVRRTLDGYTSAWVGMNRESCEATKIKGEQSDKLMDLRMLCLNRRLGETRALTEVFAARTDAEVLDKAVQASMGLIPLSQCADEKALLADVPPPEDPATRLLVEAIRKRLGEAEALERTGKFDDGLNLAQETVAACEKTAYKPVVAEALFQVGRLLEKVGKYREAEQNLRQAAKVADTSGHDRLRAEALTDLIYLVGFRQARYKAAEKIAEVAERVLERIKDEGELKARWLNNTGGVYDEKGELDRALEFHERALRILERVLGQEHPDVATSHNNIGIVFTMKGEYDRALEHYKRALKIRENVLGPDHPDVAASLNNIGAVFIMKVEYDRALEFHERALKIREQALGPNHPDVAVSCNNLGFVFYNKGEYDRALEHYERALKIDEKALGPEHFFLAEPLSGIGWIRLKNNDYSSARELFERVLSICGSDNCSGTSLVPLSEARFGLAQILWKAPAGADRERALQLVQEALKFLKTDSSVSGKQMLMEAESWLRERGVRLE